MNRFAAAANPGARGGLPLALLLAWAILLAIPACKARTERRSVVMPGGEPERGKVALREYDCISCHSIPGIEGARSEIGPSLEGIASRASIAGVLPNTPENMIRWIMDPSGVDSLTEMPDAGVTIQDARDMASYLYTLP